MASIQVVTDSACDLTPATTEERDVRVVPLTIRFGKRGAGRPRRAVGQGVLGPGHHRSRHARDRRAVSRRLPPGLPRRRRGRTRRGGLRHHVVGSVGHLPGGAHRRRRPARSHPVHGGRLPERHHGPGTARPGRVPTWPRAGAASTTSSARSRTLRSRTHVYGVVDSLDYLRRGAASAAPPTWSGRCCRSSPSSRCATAWWRSSPSSGRGRVAAVPGRTRPSRLARSNAWPSPTEWPRTSTSCCRLARDRPSRARDGRERPGSGRRQPTPGRARSACVSNSPAEQARLRAPDYPRAYDQTREPTTSPGHDDAAGAVAGRGGRHRRGRRHRRPRPRRPPAPTRRPRPSSSGSSSPPWRGAGRPALGRRGPPARRLRLRRAGSGRRMPGRGDSSPPSGWCLRGPSAGRAGALERHEHARDPRGRHPRVGPRRSHGRHLRGAGQPRRPSSSRESPRRPATSRAGS